MVENCDIKVATNRPPQLIGRDWADVSQQDDMEVVTPHIGGRLQFIDKRLNSAVVRPASLIGCHSARNAFNIHPQQVPNGDLSALETAGTRAELRLNEVDFPRAERSPFGTCCGWI